MLSMTIAVILAVMLVGLARAFKGPNVFVRIQAANLFGTKTVLLIACISYLFASPGLLDIAVVYALINYIGIVGVLRTIELRPEQPREPAE